MVGVVAKLATVDNQTLSEILAEKLYDSLTYVVVESTECRERLCRTLEKKRLPCPDILPYDQLVSYR